MKKIEVVIANIKRIKGYKTDTEVAKALGYKKTSGLTSHKTRDSTPDNKLFAFCEKEGVSLEELLADQGPSNGEKDIDKGNDVNVNYGNPEHLQEDAVRDALIESQAEVIRLMKKVADLENQLSQYREGSREASGDR